MDPLSLVLGVLLGVGIMCLGICGGVLYHVARSRHYKHSVNASLLELRQQSAERVAVRSREIERPQRLAPPRAAPVGPAHGPIGQRHTIAAAFAAEQSPAPRTPTGRPAVMPALREG